MKFRPRFSVRTLAIFVTLVCAYFAAWEATKRWGIPDSTVDIPRTGSGYTVRQPTKGRLIHTRNTGVAAVITAGSPAPFVIRTEELVVDVEVGRIKHVMRYYLWFFGPTIKLPFESDW